MPRVDAQASSTRAGIGGWFPYLDENGSIDQWKSPWFSLEVTSEARWIYERGDKPALLVSTLEALAVLMALKLYYGNDPREQCYFSHASPHVHGQQGQWLCAQQVDEHEVQVVGSLDGTFGVPQASQTQGASRVDSSRVQPGGRPRWPMVAQRNWRSTNLHDCRKALEVGKQAEEAYRASRGWWTPSEPREEKTQEGDLRIGFERRTHGEESSRNVITISSSDGSDGSFLFSFLATSSDKPFAFPRCCLHPFILSRFYPGSLFLSIAVLEGRSGFAILHSDWEIMEIRMQSAISFHYALAGRLFYRVPLLAHHNTFGVCHGADSFESAPPLRLRGRIGVFHLQRHHRFSMLEPPSSSSSSSMVCLLREHGPTLLRLMSWLRDQPFPSRSGSLPFFRSPIREHFVNGEQPDVSSRLRQRACSRIVLFEATLNPTCSAEPIVSGATGRAGPGRDNAGGSPSQELARTFPES